MLRAKDRNQADGWFTLTRYTANPEKKTASQSPWKPWWDWKTTLIPWQVNFQDDFPCSQGGRWMDFPRNCSIRLRFFLGGPKKTELFSKGQTCYCIISIKLAQPSEAPKSLYIFWWSIELQTNTLSIQVCPKKGINPRILLWGWDSDHQSYEFSGGVWILRDTYRIQVLPTFTINFSQM